MKLANFKQSVIDAIESNDVEGFEEEITILGRTYFVGELNVDFTKHYEQGDPDTNYHAHTIYENIQLYSCDVMNVDTQNKTLWVEQILKDLFN